MIYYFCGHRGCGKNYLADQLTKNTSIQIIDTGPIIRKVYAKYNPMNQTFKEWIESNEAKYGNNFSNDVICKMIEIDPNKSYIVIGYRSLEGIKYFCEHFKINDFKIIFIDGDFELFRSNYNKRENLDISRQEYKKIIEIENLMGIQELRDFAKRHKEIAEYYFKTQNDDTIYEHLLRKMTSFSKER